MEKFQSHNVHKIVDSVDQRDIVCTIEGKN